MGITELIALIGPGITLTKELATAIKSALSGSDPTPEEMETIKAQYAASCKAWDAEAEHDKS